MSAAALAAAGGLHIIRMRIGASEAAILARALHAALQVGKDFSTWMKAQIRRGGFVAGEDFALLTQKGEQTGRGGKNRVEYAVSLDMARHIALMSGTPRGREYRARLIEAEQELQRLKAAAGLTAAHELARLYLERDRLEAAGRAAGRTLGRLRRHRANNDREAAPLLAIINPMLPGFEL
jgi:phage anti-repressor protein